MNEVKYKLNGEVVSREEFMAGAPGLKPGEVPMIASPSCWPKKCQNLWVNPSQIEAAKASAAKRGMNIEFDRQGYPILTREQRRDYALHRGLTDMDAGYADPVSEKAFDPGQIPDCDPPEITDHGK